MFILSLQKDQISYVGTPSKPIDFVVVGVLLCLGSEIIEKGFKEKFKEVKTVFSNKKIKIICKCEEKDKFFFKEVYESCYILNNLKIDKEVVFI